MSWLWGSAKPEPPKPKPPPPPECPPGGNLNLAPKLRHADVGYSGFLFQLGEGWMGSHHERQWVALGGPQEGRQLYLKPDPTSSTHHTVLPVKGAAVTVGDDAGKDDFFEFTVSSRGSGYSERFMCGSEAERAQWIARISIAVMQADEGMQLADADLNKEWLATIAAGPTHIVPSMDASEMPEKRCAAKVQGYVSCRHESESFLGAMFGFGGADWKRRWVTVHDSFLTVRDDKSAPTGFKVVPMRDIGVEWGSISGHPWSFTLTGPFIPDLTLSFDAKEKYKLWRVAVMEATRNNSAATGEPEDIPALIEAELAEIEEDMGLQTAA